MNVLKKNIVANFGGSIWIALMGLLFAPLYIHFIGIEAYGLMGIFATLLAMFALLDMGLSSTLNREMARLAVQEGKAREMRDLVRTMEIPYWAVGLLISLVVIALSPFIAYRWVNPEDLSPKTVQTAFILMGLCVAFRWPLALYSGGLKGLQHQVLLNGINAVMATFRGLGAVLILWFVSPTVEAFFLWQIVVSVIHTGLIVFFLWRSLPHAVETPRFRRELFLNIWRFAAGMTGITVLITILMQLDKVILSRILSLEMFGYYTLASAIAAALGRCFIGPVFSSVFPRLTNLVSLNATKDLARLYHKCAQLVSVLVLPIAIVVAFFSKELLLLWTQSPVTAKNAYMLVSILITAKAIRGLMNVPYTLQLASGWTRLTFNINLVSVLIMAPLVILLSKWYGAKGAASALVILNTGYLIVGIQLMHRRLLPAEKWRWCSEDVGRPLLAALAVGVCGRYIITMDWGVVPFVISLAVLSAATLLTAACAANKLNVVTRVVLILFKLMSLLGEKPRSLATFWRAQYASPREPELTNLDRIIDIFSLDTKRTAVDVGANCGVWTRALARKFSEVVAIEPNPNLSNILARKIRATVIQAAVSNVSKTVQLWIPHNKAGALVGWASLDSKNCPDAISKERIDVQTKLLNDILKDYSPSFIKMDVEGHEYEALQGAVEVIRTSTPVILCEIRPSNLDRIQILMKSLNYSTVKSKDILNIQTSDEMFFFIPSDKSSVTANLQKGKITS